VSRSCAWIGARTCCRKLFWVACSNSILRCATLLYIFRRSRKYLRQPTSIVSAAHQACGAECAGR
jgi:hypothetical protein